MTEACIENHTNGKTLDWIGLGLTKTSIDFSLFPKLPTIVCSTVSLVPKNARTTTYIMKLLVLDFLLPTVK